MIPIAVFGLFAVVVFWLLEFVAGKNNRTTERLEEHRSSGGSTRPGERTSWLTTTALGAVDDERALGRHHREVTHEHRLAL